MCFGAPKNLRRVTVVCVLMNKEVYWRFAAVSSLQLLAGGTVLTVLAVYFSSLGFSDS